MKIPRLRWRKTSTLYRRSFLQMCLAILVIFAFLALSSQMSLEKVSRMEEERQLRLSAEALAERIGEAFDSDHLRLERGDVRSDTMFTARSADAIVWIANSQGELVYFTALPQESAEGLRRNGEDVLLLPEAALDRVGSEATELRRDRYYQLLPPSSDWLSVSFRLASETGAYAGEVILHRRIMRSGLVSTLYQNFVPAFFFSLGIAVVIFFFLSRSISRPIKELADTAERVYHGDLSARVQLRNREELRLTSGREREEDDALMLLVKTMNSMIEKLEDQERERRDFLASVSHDLRSPLTSIRGFVSGILDGTLPMEEAGEYLEIVKEESDRLQNLVNNLFQLSLVEDTERFHPLPFDLDRLLHEQVDSVKTKLMDAEIQAELRIPPYLQGDNSKIDGEEALIARVLQNLLENALRYTPCRGRLRLSLERDRERNKFLEVWVEDSGPGIPEAESRQVFERFYKMDKARGSGQGGSGLGLYIAKKIVQKHSGKISVDRSPDLGGARFRFTLPQA